MEVVLFGDSHQKRMVQCRLISRNRVEYGCVWTWETTKYWLLLLGIWSFTQGIWVHLESRPPSPCRTLMPATSGFFLLIRIGEDLIDTATEWLDAWTILAILYHTSSQAPHGPCPRGGGLCGHRNNSFIPGTYLYIHFYHSTMFYLVRIISDLGPSVKSIENYSWQQDV